MIWSKWIILLQRHFCAGKSTGTKNASNAIHCKILLVSSENGRFLEPTHIPQHWSPTPMKSAVRETVVQCTILTDCTVLKRDINNGRKNGGQQDRSPYERQTSLVSQGRCFHTCVFLPIYLLALGRRAEWRREDKGWLRNNERPLSQNVIEIQGREKTKNIYLSKGLCTNTCIELKII